MATVLVTGATGFIGSHVVEALTSRHDVVGLASSVYPSPRDAVRQVRMTLPHPDLEELVATLRPDVVVHCAGVASVGLSMHSPGVDFQSGPPVVFQLFDAIRKAGLASKVVLLSSAAVYGNPQSLPVGEDAPRAPISPYGWHKGMCEDIAQEFHGTYGIRSAVLRIFSCYGAGLRKQLLWDAGHKLLEGAFVFDGTGDETRDFIHVRDVAAFVTRLVEGWPDGGCVVCNVASGEATRIADLLALLPEAFGLSGVVPVFTGRVRGGDPHHWRADISRARQMGLAPAVSLEEGVREYAKWFFAVTGGERA